MDSVYHRLETLTNMAFKVLRQMQGRPLEPEYFNADRVGAQQQLLVLACLRIVKVCLLNVLGSLLSRGVPLNCAQFSTGYSSPGQGGCNHMTCGLCFHTPVVAAMGCLAQPL